jgi:RNA polymerase sigma-70 factor (ECF subfamily)
MMARAATGQGSLPREDRALPTGPRDRLYIEPRSPVPGFGPSVLCDPRGQERVDLADEATDGEVIRAVLAGDVERYAVLVARYRDRFARYAARMLGSNDAAEDAVQDALIRAFVRLGDCREPHKFGGWLFLIVRNRCFAERRRPERHGRSLEIGDEVLAAPDRSDEALEQAESAEALERALQMVTPEQREVFVLKHVEGLPYEEIAALIGVSVGSLKMRMHRAYDRLRELLTKEHL